MGVFILPLLAATILVLVVYYGRLIFKPERQARPPGEKLKAERTRAQRPRRRSRP